MSKPSPIVPAAGPRPESMLRRIPEVLRYTIHVDSFLAMGALALLLSILEWVGTLPGVLFGGAYLLARLLWGGYFLLVARKASLGSKRLPIPADHLDTWGTLIMPLARVSAATALLWIALLITIVASVGPLDFVERYRAHTFMFLCQQRAMGNVILIGGMLYLPLGMLSVLRGLGLGQCLDPRSGYLLAWSTGEAYPIFFATLTLFSMIGFLLDLGGGTLENAMPIPLAAPVLSHLVRLWVPLAQSRLLGGFVFYNRSLMHL